MVEQHAKPHRVSARLRQLNIPQGTLAEFANLSQPAISLFLTGQKGLSSDAQGAVFKALKFFEELAEEAGVPIDFSNLEGLRPLWKKHLRLESESELIRLAGEPIDT